LGEVLKTTVQLLGSYDLRSAAELKEHKPRPEDECQLIETWIATMDSTVCSRGAVVTAPAICLK
jgi:hypothetical protein